ncbi:MAG: OsmC family protein [Vicinamibacterales bacterium]
MIPFPHRYEAHLDGGPDGPGVLSSPGKPALETEPPVEFGGPGTAWSPEHLLLAAVQACFLFTFRAVARASHLDYTALAVDAIGVVDRDGRITKFTEILLEARLTVAPGTDEALALRALTKTEGACLVSASLSTPIRLTPRVVESLVTASHHRRPA